MDRGRFGRWLDITMSNTGIQGRDLAELLGVTNGAVSRWRNGKSVPKQSKLKDLAEIFDVELLRLMALAGITGVQDSGVEPLPLPNPDGYRERTRAELKAISHLDKDEQQAMLEAYDRIVRERDVMSRPLHESAELLKERRDAGQPDQ